MVLAFMWGIALCVSIQSIHFFYEAGVTSNGSVVL